MAFDEDDLIFWRMRQDRVCARFGDRLKIDRSLGVFVRHTANRDAEKHRDRCRDMMMNGPVSGGGVNDRLAGLHRKLKRIAGARAKLDAIEAEALREAQRVGLWREM